MIQIDIEQISQMARKVAEQISGVRQKSKSIKKDNLACSNSANNTFVKNINSLQTTLNSTSASYQNSSASGIVNNNNVQNNNNNNSNNLSVSNSTNASISSIQKRVKFTQQEDEVILKYVQKYGKKWSEISKRLPGRTEVMVRNRYYVKIRKISKEKDNGCGDQSVAQNESEAGLFYAENSSLDCNEQASELYNVSSASGIQKYNQQSQQIQQNAQKDDKQRTQDEILNNNGDNYGQNMNNYPLYYNHNFNNNDDIFDSPIKQGIFEDDGLLPFNHNQMDSLHHFEEHNDHRQHNFLHKDQQNLFGSAIKEYPEIHQNAFSHQNLNINQENEFYDHNNLISKAALLQNQQYIQQPFQNGIESIQMQQEDDDYFEEANKPFKLPKFDLQDDDLSDISNLLPPVGLMDININLNNSAINKNNSMTPTTSIDSIKQEKIQFLQNQISMIENMLNMCKDEIIREFAQRKSISSNPDQTKTFNQNGSLPSTQLQQLVIAKQELEEAASIQQQEAFTVNNNLQNAENQSQLMDMSMDIEDNINSNNKSRFLFEQEGHGLNANDHFNYPLHEQSQMITSLNNF